MERGLADPTRRMFVIWGLHGEGRCHGGVVTAFFVDTSGESPTCADQRTERVGLGRSRTRPNPTAQLSLGGWHPNQPPLLFHKWREHPPGRPYTCCHKITGANDEWFNSTLRLQFPVSAPLSGASRSWVGVPGVRRSGRLKPIPTRREEPRFTASAFFLGLTGDADGILVAHRQPVQAGRRTTLPAERLKEGPPSCLYQPAGLFFSGLRDHRTTDGRGRCRFF